MLAISFYSLHIEGGPPFMFPLSFLFLVNICIFGYVAIAVIQKKPFNPNWLEAIKQIGGLAAAFGTWGTLMGLFFAFSALEESKDIIPFQVIMGGLKVGLITVLYGLIIFCLSMLAYISLKLVSRTTSN